MKPAVAVASLACALVACARPAPGPTTVVRREVIQGLIDVPGARLYYEMQGRGAPVVVVHGGPGMDHMYLLPGMSGLASTNRLVFYDQRGSGRTQGNVDSSTVSFSTFMADIDALGDSLRLGRFVLLGHSWGGLLAMRYAARHPDRLRALILMNTVEPGMRYAQQTRALLKSRQTPQDSSELMAILARPGLRERDTASVNGMLRVAFRPTFADRARASEVAINLDPRTAKNMAPVATFLMGPLGRYDLWPEAARIRVPTLIVQGAADVMPVVMVQELARTIPGAQLALVENAGHFPYIERPEETFAAIRRFLAAHP